ncbi:MAG TPA: hypothetical protein VGC16_00530, partial [Rhizomicrobium sp.]
GTQIRLLAERPGQPLVDGQGRVLDARSRAMPSLYGIGLAAGFAPPGGEASFSGQPNGVWLWQNEAGTVIARHLLGLRGMVGTSPRVIPPRPAARRSAVA